MAGGGDDRIRFSADAHDVVYRGSGGVPRLINVICDRAMQKAYLGRLDCIGPDRVRQAVADLGLDVESGSNSSSVIVDPVGPSEPRGSSAKTVDAPFTLAELAEPKFLPVTLKGSAVEIELPNGGSVKVPVGVGEAVLVKIIEAVGAMRPRLGRS